MKATLNQPNRLRRAAYLTDFRRFVELYIGKSEDRLPRQKFANFLETLVDAELTGARSTEIKRGIESMLLLGSYVLEQYERVGNHVAAAEGWTIIGANILHVAEREDLSKNQYLPSLDLAWTGLQRCLAAFESEVLSREHLVVDDSYFMVEPQFHGPRISLVLGWLRRPAMRSCDATWCKRRTSSWDRSDRTRI